VGAGADEILIPMVRSPAEVDFTLEIVGGRCGVGVLIETVEAVRGAAEIARLPIARAYVGLNDLCIARRTPSIFTALTDGTIEALRDHFTVPFGFGGLTLPDRGAPIPCRLLIAEMIRLRSSFSFLRRSFHRDVQGRPIGPSVELIRDAIASARDRNDAEVKREASELRELVAA
jgi:hypothetical protein